jgi:hypothetical protein
MQSWPELHFRGRKKYFEKNKKQTHSSLGNCDIHAERNILFINETKWYKIQPRPKIQKLFIDQTYEMRQACVRFECISNNDNPSNNIMTFICKPSQKERVPVLNIIAAQRDNIT